MGLKDYGDIRLGARRIIAAHRGRQQLYGDDVGDPVAPAAISETVISGVAVEGQTLTATPGVYSGYPAPSIARQWRRGTSNIAGATGLTYTLTAADIGAQITVRETATNAAGSTQATSAGVGPVAAAATAPAQFASGNWSVATGAADNEVTLTVSALPANGGSAITALEYTINGGTTWTALSGTGTGPRPLTMAAAGTAYTFALRAVNAVGAGTASATKSATSGASIALTLTQITDLKVYQRTTATGGANGLGAGSVPISVAAHAATPVYARLVDPDTDAVVVAAAKIGDATPGANAFTIAAPARLGWYRLDLAPGAAGPWTQGTTRFGMGRVILGVGQSQIGRLAAKVDTTGGTIAAMVPGATPYGSVRNHYTGSGFDTQTKGAGWQIPSDTDGAAIYNGVGAAELLRLQVAQHGVTCAWVCYGRSGSTVDGIITSTGQTQLRNILAEAGGWEAFWFYIGSTDVTASTAEATFAANVATALADINSRNGYGGTVTKIFTATATRFGDGAFDQVNAIRRQMRAAALAEGGTWVEPRDNALVDNVHPTQAGNITLANAAHKGLAGAWIAPTVVSSAISGATITLTFSEPIELIGNPVGRVAVYPAGTSTGGYTVSSLSVSGAVLTITLSAAPSGQVDVWVYPFPDSATKSAQYIRAVDDATPVEATTSAIVLGAAATAPAQFASGNWSVATGAADNEVTLTVSALPANGGSAITALEYTINGGTTWTALSGTGTGTRTLTMAAAGTAYTFALRAVNAVGAGTASATKSATSGTGAVTRAWVFTDTFTGHTDQTAIGGTTSTSGHDWTAGAGGVLWNNGTINGLAWTAGQAKAFSAFADDDVAIELDTAKFGPTGATGAPWILARVDAAGTTHYQAGTDQAGTKLRIGKTVAGTFTEIGSLTRTAPAVGTQETWRFEIEGTTLRFYVNGVLEVTATDATITGAGRIGLYSSNSDGASPTNYNLRKAMRASPLETAPLAA